MSILRDTIVEAGRRHLWSTLLSHCNWLDDTDREPEINEAIVALEQSAARAALQMARERIVWAIKDGEAVEMIDQLLADLPEQKA